MTPHRELPPLPTADRAALLQAVAAAPDDDTLRLVYADFLEENGWDIRAELIRVQCELAQTPEPDLKTIGRLLGADGDDDCRWQDGGLCTACQKDRKCAYHVLERRQELLGDHSKTLLPAGWDTVFSNNNPGDDRTVVFERGFVVEVSASWKDVADPACGLDALRAAEPGPGFAVHLRTVPRPFPLEEDLRDRRVHVLVAGRRIAVDSRTFAAGRMRDQSLPTRLDFAGRRWPGLAFDAARARRVAFAPGDAVTATPDGLAAPASWAPPGGYIVGYAATGTNPDGLVGLSFGPELGVTNVTAAFEEE